MLQQVTADRRLAAFDADRFLAGLNQPPAGDPSDAPLAGAVVSSMRQAAVLTEATRSVVFVRATHLQLHGGGVLGPARHLGKILVWGMWLPHRRALFDIFKRRMPDEAEMRARVQFAEANGLAYGWVPPDWAASLDDIKAWLDEHAK